VQKVGRKTSWAKDVWANYFLGDRRLGDNSHFKKVVSAKDGWATKAGAVCIPVSITSINSTSSAMMHWMQSFNASQHGILSTGNALVISL